jgi:hypothetical protein
MLNEILLKFFVGKVDTQLLKTVKLKRILDFKILLVKSFTLKFSKPKISKTPIKFLDSP